MSERYRVLSWFGFIVFIWTFSLGLMSAYNVFHKFLENRKDKLVEFAIEKFLRDIFEQIKNLLNHFKR